MLLVTVRTPGINPGAKYTTCMFAAGLQVYPGGLLARKLPGGFAWTAQYRPEIIVEGELADNHLQVRTST